MEGRGRSFERELDVAMFTAWNTARFSTFSKKLPSLKDELDGLNNEPKKVQTNEEIVAVFRSIAAKSQSAETRD